MVSRTLFGIQRQSSLMAREDKTWSSASVLLSRDNQVQWHAETKHGHPYILCHPETIKFDDTCIQNMVIHTLFAIQRKSSPMPREDKHGHSHPFSYRETIKSDGMQRQNMVIRTLFGIQRQSSPVARGDKTWYPHPFCYPETIKSDDMQR